MEDLSISVNSHERKPEKSSLKNYHHDNVRWLVKMTYFTEEMDFYNRILLLEDLYIDNEYSDRKAAYLQEILRGLTHKIEDCREKLMSFEDYLAECFNSPKNVNPDETFKIYENIYMKVHLLLNELNDFKKEVFHFVKKLRP